MIKNYIYTLLCLFCVSAFWVTPVIAQSVKPASAEDIERAESYLQNLKTMKARFVQTAHDGSQISGTFYLNRPGKLRFEYDPPVENFVVADGLFIYFYDAELEEQTNAPIGSTLANFFLREDLALSGDLLVQDARIGGGLLQIDVVQASEPEGGMIIFGFSQEPPFALRKWRIIDPQGLRTEVELFHLKENIELDSDLFKYRDPKHGDDTPHYND